MGNGPLFLLQISDRNGVVVRFAAGGHVERDFIAICTAAIVKRGVGFLKTEAVVKQAIEDGITQAIRDLKMETIVLAK